MSVLDFMDGWLTDEERDVLDGWSATLEQFPVDDLGPDETPDPSAMMATLDTIRAQGWCEIGYDPDVSPVLFVEAIKRLHQRDVPLPVPLAEAWFAIRLLRDLRSGGDTATMLLQDATGTGAHLTLAVDDLFHPADMSNTVTTGRVPFADSLAFLLPVRHGGDVRVLLVPPDAGERRRVASLDPSVPLYRVTLTSPDALTDIGRLSPTTWRTLRSQVLTAHAAAMVGQAQAMLSATVGYLQVREQFGVPIGTFQALKHRGADLVTDLHVANLISGYAALRLLDEDSTAMLGVLAKAFCGRAALRVASEAVQLHGGMGFTWECNVHRGLKRCSYLAMAGQTIGDCETALGDWAIDAGELTWPGGISASAAA